MRRLLIGCAVHCRARIPITSTSHRDWPVRLLFVVCFVIVACSQTTTPPPRTDPPPTLLTVTLDVGGFGFGRLDEIPNYVLHRDGRLFLPGSDGSTPGRTVAEPLVATVTANDLDEIGDLIGHSGLADQPPDEHDDNAQGAVDVFRYYSDDGIHTFAAPVGSRSPIYSEMIDLLDAASSEAEPYVGDRVQIIAGYMGTMLERLTTREPWPLPVPFEEMDEWAGGLRCLVLTPDQTSEVLPVLENTDRGYLWGEDEHSMLARILLPEEEGCPLAPESLRNMPPPTAPPVTS